ncbi:hypothetical protein DH2020_032296 [Rehmannia glutinosa]|uniref:1-phosphatidylinositol 4-kinase n=1 Tax=Rehmannia glutinosa TaxID=99300 RepID=A0ABR0VFJ6_REHGL
MSRNLDSPVHTQMAVAAFKSPFGSGEYRGTNRMEGNRPAGDVFLYRLIQVVCWEWSWTGATMHILDSQRRDQSGPIEILGHSNRFAKTKQLVKEIVKGMKNGVDPIPVHSGLGGAYYFRNVRGESVAIVKPTDEEPFARTIQKALLFPVSGVHRIGILDIRILNTDRHAGNLLVRKLDDVGRFGQVELIPIDHGLCLPESLEDPYFEWIHWPQASIPFSDDELSTSGTSILLEFRSGDEEPSELEVICIEARRLIAEEMLSQKGEPDFDEVQFDLDCEDGGYQKLPSEDFVAGPPFHFGFGSVNGCTPLSKLDECVEEEEEESEGENQKRLVSVSTLPKCQNISKLSMSLKNTSLGEKKLKFPKFSGAKQEFGSLATSSSSGHRSVNEQLPASVSFVKLADMTETNGYCFWRGSRSYSILRLPNGSLSRWPEAETEARDFLPVLRVLKYE